MGAQRSLRCCCCSSPMLPNAAMISDDIITPFPMTRACCSQGLGVGAGTGAPCGGSGGRWAQALQFIHSRTVAFFIAAWIVHLGCAMVAAGATKRTPVYADCQRNEKGALRCHGRARKGGCCCLATTTKFVPMHDAPFNVCFCSTMQLAAIVLRWCVPVCASACLRARGLLAWMCVHFV